MHKFTGHKPVPMRTIHLLLLTMISTSTWAQARLESSQPYGGMNALDRLYAQELRYPEAYLESKKKGEVVIAVNVQGDGTVSNMQVLRPLDPACDMEAMRLIKLVRWAPSTATEGRGGGEHYLAVPFDPGKYRRWSRERPERRSPVFDLPGSATNELFDPKQLNTQVVPLVPGGNAGLGAHLAQHMRYPEEARRRSIEGNVELEFVVEISGAVTNMHAIKELGGGCTLEAMRLVERTPWAPGLKDGQRVRSVSRVTIGFALPKDRH